MSTVLWPACASRSRPVRGSPLEVNLTETTIETNNSLLIRTSLLQSSAARLRSGCELLEANRDIAAGNSTLAGNHEAVPASPTQLASNHVRLEANSRLKANAGLTRSSREPLQASAAKFGVAA